MRIWKWIKKKLNLYKIEELQIGGHCGLCGKWVEGEILPKDWAITICENCGDV